MMYLRDGFIVQQDGNFGDTANRHGLWQLAISLRWLRYLPELHKDYGVVPWSVASTRCGMPEMPMRSPWGNGNAGKFSRDQAIPNLCAVKVLDLPYDSGMWNRNIRRKWNKGLLPAFPNGDLATPQVFNLLNKRLSTLGLLELLANCMLCAAKMDFNSDDTDQTINTFAMFATLYTIYPESKILKACKYVLQRLHPGVKKAFFSYFRPEMGGNIELAQVWEPIIDDILK